jgi:antitoxin (DNA-binding transcriptional repressor) of toxin-antitoxin stability system
MSIFVTVEELQKRAPDILAKLCPGEELFIEQDGQTVAKLIGLHSPGPRVPQLGSGKGSIVYMAPDFIAPLMLVEDPDFKRSNDSSPTEGKPE